MGKKKFEEIEYDPIEAEAKRALARAVSKPGIPAATGQGTIEPSKIVQMQVPSMSSNQAPKEIATPTAHRKPKSRTFSCASVEQDTELEAFLWRLKEAGGVHVSFQVIMRAACVASMRAEEQIISEMRKSPPPPPPATYAHEEYAQFEEYWLDVFSNAMRKARPVR